MEEWVVRGDLWTGLEEELIFWRMFGHVCLWCILIIILLRFLYALKDAIDLRHLEKDYEKYHYNFSYPRFFKGECRTYDGLYIDRIWLFTDKELEKNPHVIHYLFPEKKEEAIFYPFVTQEDIDALKGDPQALKAIQKSVEMMEGFWKRGGTKRTKDVKMMKNFLIWMGLETMTKTPEILA